MQTAIAAGADSKAKSQGELKEGASVAEAAKIEKSRAEAALVIADLKSHIGALEREQEAKDKEIALLRQREDCDLHVSFCLVPSEETEQLETQLRSLGAECESLKAQTRELPKELAREHEKLVAAQTEVR